MNSSLAAVCRRVLALALTVALATTLALATTTAAQARGINLHRGSKGSNVRVLENRLHRLDLLTASAVDGHYLQATVNAVKRFQRRQHIRITGRVNQPVWNLIARAVARRAHPLPPAPGIIGHRGATVPGVPENTMKSLRYATGYADVLEFDLRLTSDHEIVLMHDSTLNRTTNCTGKVVDWTLADLREKCRVAGQPIPTFAEVAAYASKVAPSISPELKNQDFSNEDIDKVIALLDQYHLIDRTYLQSFTIPVLQRVHQLRPQLKTVLLSIDPPSARKVEDVGATRVAVGMDHITSAWVKRYQRFGLKVWTFTALDQAGLRAARALGVNSVVTDVPRQAYRYYGR